MLHVLHTLNSEPWFLITNNNAPQYNSKVNKLINNKNEKKRFKQEFLPF